MWHVTEFPQRHDFVRNVDIRRVTNQPPLSSTIKSRRLTFLRILHEWMRTQMLPKPSSNLLHHSIRELEATTGAAAHNLDEEHS